MISCEAASSDGTHLRFTLRAADTLSFSLWEVSLDSTGLRSLLPATFHQDPGECCGKWTPQRPLLLSFDPRLCCVLIMVVLLFASSVRKISDHISERAIFS